MGTQQLVSREQFSNRLFHVLTPCFLKLPASPPHSSPPPFGHLTGKEKLKESPEHWKNPVISFPTPPLPPQKQAWLKMKIKKKKDILSKKEVFRQSLSASISQLSKLPCPESDSRFHKLTENPSSQEPKLSLLCLQLWFRIGARLFTVLINAPFQCGIGEGKWTGLINRCSCSVLYLGSFRTCNRLIRLDWTWTS